MAGTRSSKTQPDKPQPAEAAGSAATGGEATESKGPTHARGAGEKPVPPAPPAGAVDEAPGKALDKAPDNAMGNGEKPAGGKSDRAGAGASAKRQGADQEQAKGGAPDTAEQAGPVEPSEDEGAPETVAKRPANPPADAVPLPEQRPEPPKNAARGPTHGASGAAAKPATASSPTDDSLTDKKIAITPAAAVMAAAAIVDARQCEAELAKRGVRFTVEPSISEGECGVLRPVNVERLSSGVRVGPRTQLLCSAALALDTWMSDTVVPAATAAFPDDRITDFSQASTYVCRTRSSEAGISEHARGSAIDIGRFDFKSGRQVGIEHHRAGSPEATFQRAIREGACGPFKTVLGPGTDADHASHFHLDVEARRNGATYCK